MRSSRLGLASIAVVAALAVGVLGPPTGAAPGGLPATAPSDAGPTAGPPLPTHAQQAPARTSSRGPSNAPSSATVPGDGNLRKLAATDPEQTVVVEVLHDAGLGANVSKRIVELGGKVHGPIADVGVEGEVPAGAVAALEATPGVQSVAEPARLAPEMAVTEDGSEQSVQGSEVALTNADDWQAAGINGTGVKVGIIDSFVKAKWDASVASGDLAAEPAGTFCRDAGASCDIWDGVSHGVAVGETVHEMAPAALLYIASVYTAADFQAAINYFQAQGVKVVTRSQTYTYDGPGDGTGPVAAVIDSAVSKGMVYLNSAGNSAGGSGYTGSYWRGNWVDVDNDGWLEFGAGDELMATKCWYWNGLRWNDWGANRTDYDLYVYDTGINKIGGSENNQTTGAAPIEGNNNANCGASNATVYIGVWKFAAGNGTAGDVLEFMVNGVGVEHWSNPYSAGGPMADTKNAGALTIGAVDPAASGTIAPYSSQGPTNDARMKPDLSAPACFASTAYSPNCFNGTSAATPVVAGAAALAWSAGASTTPSGIATFLKASVVDRGTAGGDNVYGRGELRLPVAPAPFKTFGALVDRQYLDFLGRAPTSSERTAWISKLSGGTSTRGSLVQALRTSDENVLNVDPVTRLYSAYFLRIPDAGGLTYWIGKRRKGAKLDTISQSFASSSEFKTRYGSLTNSQFVDLIYHNLFDRNPDPSGKAYWVGKLNSGAKNRGQVMAGFSESNEYKTDQVKPVNAAVGVIFMLKRKPTQAEFDGLVAGAGTGGSVAEWVFSSGAYKP